MAIGDVRRVTSGTAAGVWTVDTGMFGTAEYGCAYLLEGPPPAILETGTGANADRILAGLETLDVAPADVATVAVTHVHLDHAGGAGILAEACPDATVVVSEAGAPHLADPSRLVAGTKDAVGAAQWRHYADPVPVPRDRLRTITDGDRLAVAGRELVVHAMPGHAPHQVALESPADDAILTGDAAGIWLPTAGRVAPTSPPPQFDLEQALADVEALAALDRPALWYTHAGARPRGDALERYAAVLRRFVARVEAALERHGDVAAVLEALDPHPDHVAVWGTEKARAELALNVRGASRWLAG